MITINSHTRQFSVPGADLTFGVTGDSNTEVKHFTCPRYVGDNLDVTSCFVRINYRNANGETDFYLVNDVAVDGDNVTFSWLLTPKVTAYKGQIKFVLCLIGPDLKLKWHTTQGTGQVLEGLEPDHSHIESQTADVVAQLIAMVDAQTAVVEQVGAEQVASVNSAAETARTTAVNEIEAKRTNSLASIPNDYTALSNTVESLERGRAGVIVCEAEGAAVAVSDASDMAIQGLKFFGRSTQNGVPAPDNPVEIVSAESPGAIVCGKNLLNIDVGLNANFTKENDIYTITRNEDASRFSHVIPLNIPANTRVMFSFDLVESAKSSNNLPFYYIGESGENYYLSTHATATSVYPENIIGIRFYLQSTEELGAYIRVKNVQIEVGPERTAYEPYKPLQTVETTRTLRGIPVTSGGNYTDANGQQWICDEVDLERGVYVQRVALDKLSVVTYYLNDRLYCKLDSGTSKYELVYICTHSTTDIAFGNGTKGAYTNCIIGHNVLPDVVTDLATGKEWLDQQTAVGTPITVGYVLTTPIETPLSESELAAYRALHSNCPNTTVLNDAGAHMVVKYAADTKLYIDKKIKEALQ